MTRFIATLLPVLAFAQGARGPEPLSSWLYYKELRLPPAEAGLFDVTLDRDALDKSRADHADLRLYDRNGREVPYALRIRRDVDTQDVRECREYNRVTDGGAASISCDLGEPVREHNQVLVETAGENFRRNAAVQASADGTRWSSLLPDAILFRFTASGRTVEQQSLDYPVSRYRYVRIRVDRDPQTDRGAPEIKHLFIRHAVRLKGETTSNAGSLALREAGRVNSRYASTWRIDLGGRIPFESLVVHTAPGAFSRPFELSSIDDPAEPRLIASGDLGRGSEPESPDPEIRFPECFARRLKLTVTDDRNEPLIITSVAAEGAARQLIFEPAEGPIRLYYGNAKAAAPRYDFDIRLPLNAAVPTMRTSLGPQRENPDYRPEPRPFTERAPWLVYIILVIACVILAAILLSIAKAARSAAVS